jgi:hypothetical protein
VSRGYRLTPEAQADIDDICAFIAEDNVDAAIRNVPPGRIIKMSMTQTIPYRQRRSARAFTGRILISSCEPACMSCDGASSYSSCGSVRSSSPRQKRRRFNP